MQNDEAIRVLGCLREHLGGKVRTSKRGVPHLVVKDLSACYFRKSRQVRVFTNYGKNVHQERFNFDHWLQAVFFIEDRLRSA